MTTIEGLWADHQQHIWSYLYRLTRDPSAAEELTQETFLRAHQAFQRGAYREQERPKPWIFRIATNVALDELRRRRCVMFTPLDAAVVNSLFQQRRVALQRSTAVRFIDRANVEQEAISNENVAEVRDALAALPQQYRTALVLYYHEELSCAELAVALGTTHGGAKSLLFRARAALRENVEALADNRRLPAVA